VYAQIIDPQAAQNYTTNIFDATKTISEIDFPLIPFGKITLNENPVNFFAEVEQSAFNPAAVVPGWSFSPDPSEYSSSQYSFIQPLRQKTSQSSKHDSSPTATPNATAWA
jgi:hypothetical protein